QGLVARLNRRGDVGAVAPGDAGGCGGRGWGAPRLDRVSNVIVYPGGAGVSEEGVDGRSGREQRVWGGTGRWRLGHRRGWIDLGARPESAGAGAGSPATS